VFIRLHGLPCDLCGGWAIVIFSTLVPFQLFEVGLVTAPCSSLLHPFPSQRFVRLQTGQNRPKQVHRAHATTSQRTAGYQKVNEEEVVSKGRSRLTWGTARNPCFKKAQNKNKQQA
jgi:hypothetical protein